MSDEEEIMDAKERLLLQHKKQKKELQVKILSMKKSIPKGDKARIKESKKIIESMENELRLNQAKEMDDINQEENVATVNDVASKLNDTKFENCEKPKPDPKISKAQRKRDKKSAKAKELSLKLAEAEADYVNTARFKEESEIKKKLKEIGLMVKPVQPDGNCMYYAVQDQLSEIEHGILNFTELRGRTAAYMRTNESDFIPFLTNKDTGDMFTHAEFELYCDDVEKTPAWGGQLELQALAHILKLPIHVIQATAPVTIHGEEYDLKPIILTYHRHELGLGEHYNSVTTFLDKVESDPL